MHDTWVDLSVASSTLTRAAATTATQQIITFPSFTSGWLSLAIGTSKSADFNISSSSSPTYIAGQLQSALQQIVPGTTVIWLAGNQTASNASYPYNFQVTFPTAQAVITVGAPTDTTLTPALTPTPTVALQGITSSTPDCICEIYGSPGTPQYGTSIAMTSSGSFVEVWNEAALTNDGSLSTTNLYFRTFQESTDTAGPLVTDFIDPYTGERMTNGETVTDQMQYLVVTFDSDMLTTGTNSVTNVNNWELLLNGTLLTDGISEIYYGMNEAADNPLFASLHATATNKWQAVIVLNGKGSNENGTTYLQDGNYQLVATTALRDANGNVLGRTGFQTNGVQFSRSFNVVLPTDGETLVNTGSTTGNQITSEPNSQATASDANGDYVVVWSMPSGQNLSFTLTNPSAAGYFRFGFNNTTTGDIYFDPNNLAQTAANMQSALGTIEAGTTVGYDASNSTASSGIFVFDVTFATASAVLNRPLITLLGPSSYAATPLAATMNAAANTSAGLWATLYAANWSVTEAGTNEHTSNPTASAAHFHHLGQRNANGRRRHVDWRCSRG